jgi:hypothetical protein
MVDDATQRSYVPQATAVLMNRFDVSQLIAVRLLMTIAGRSTVPVEALAQRVVASSSQPLTAQHSGAWGASTLGLGG